MCHELIALKERSRVVRVGEKLSNGEFLEDVSSDDDDDE